MRRFSVPSVLTPLLVIAVASIGFSPSKSKADVQKHFTLCKLAKEVRTLWIEPAAEGKCNTQYNKFGKDSSVGISQFEASCVNILTRVKGNLEKAGWQCREVADATSSAADATAPHGE